MTVGLSLYRAAVSRRGDWLEASLPGEGKEPHRLAGVHSCFQQERDRFYLSWTYRESTESGLRSLRRFIPSDHVMAELACSDVPRGGWPVVIDESTRDQTVRQIEDVL